MISARHHKISAVKTAREYPFPKPEQNLRAARLKRNRQVYLIQQIRISPHAASKIKLQKTMQTPLLLYLMDDFIKLLKSNVDFFEELELTPYTEFNKLDCWDSLALLSTMAALSSELGIIISPVEISNCKNLGELFNVVSKKQQLP